MAAQSGAVLGGPRIEREPYFSSSPYEPVLPPPRRLSDIDLLDPDLYYQGDPHAAWRLLRREAPIFWHERGSPGTENKGFWVLSRYDDAGMAYRDPSVFSSEEGPFLDLDAATMPGRMLASMDGHAHKTNRRIVARFFTPAALRKWTGTIRDTVNDLLDRAEGLNEVDFLSDVAGRLPVVATCDLLGIARDEAGELTALLAAAADQTPEALERFNDATLGFFDRVAFERRRSGAADSIAGVVANAQVDGERLPDEDVSHLLWNLFFGGIDSTAHAATGGLLALFHHPEQFDLLRADPMLIDGAIDEIIRWTSISHANKRKVLTDIEIAGQRVRRGDYVTMWSPSANRDESAFPDPYRFDIRRKSIKPIMSFGGGGPHQCLGQFFARLELKVLFEELIRRFPTIAQAGPAVRARHFTVITAAFHALPVRLDGQA